MLETMRMKKNLRQREKMSGEEEKGNGRGKIIHL